MKKLTIIFAVAFVLMVCGAGVSYATLVYDSGRNMPVLAGATHYFDFEVSYEGDVAFGTIFGMVDPSDSNNVVLAFCLSGDSTDGLLTNVTLGPIGSHEYPYTLEASSYMPNGADDPSIEFNLTQDGPDQGTLDFDAIASNPYTMNAVYDGPMGSAIELTLSNTDPFSFGDLNDTVVQVKIQSLGSTDYSGFDEGQFQAVPEPTTVLIFSMVLGGFGALKKLF